jgi:hypothetical protein
MVLPHVSDHWYGRLFQVIQCALSLEISELDKNFKRSLKEKVNFLNYKAVYVFPLRTGQTTGVRVTCRLEQNVFHRLIRRNY